jgi:hypothetical protein
MERSADGGGRAGRCTAAVDAIRQTYQCRVPHLGLDPACQHHDAGASPGSGVAGAARAGGSGDCAGAGAARGIDGCVDGSGAGGG